MSTIVLRSVKGTPLTNGEVDANFSNLNTDKIEIGGTYSSGTASGVLFLNSSKVLTTGSALTFDGTNALSFGNGSSSTFTAARSSNGNTFTIRSGTGTDSALVLSGDSTTITNFVALKAWNSSSYNEVGIYGNGSSGYAYFNLSGSERLRIDSSGNVGIGTISPGARLDVNDTVATLINANRYSNNDAGPELSLRKSRSASLGGNTIVQNGDTLGTLVYWGANGTGYTPAASIRALVDGTPGASNDMPGRLVFLTTADNSGGPTERMRITSAGNVGIGTSSPNARLEVFGTDVNTEYFRAGDAASVRSLRFSSFAVSGTNSVGHLVNAPGSSGVHGTLAFATNSTERMRIDSAGNVGIGTSAPGVKLHVEDATTPRIYWGNSSSNFGGLVYVAGASPSLGSIEIRGQGNSNDTLITVDRGGQNLRFSTSTTERLRITSAGNVGIGTSSPTNRLDAYASHATTYSTSALNSVVADFRNTNTTDGTAGAIQLTATGSGTVGIVQLAAVQTASGSAAFAIGTRNAGTFAERLRIDSSGNVGIGTSAPIYDLQVGSYGVDADSTLALASTTAGTCSIRFGDGTAGTAANAGRIQYDHSVNAMTFATLDGSERMRIDSSGNVGIGTSSPSSALEIRTLSQAVASNGIVLVRSTDAGADIGGQITLGNTDARRASVAGRQEGASALAGYLQFGTRGSSGDITERLRLDSSGNLGLGVVPSAWNASGMNAIDMPYGYIVSQALNQITFGNNAYFDGVYKYKSSNPSSQLRIDNSGGFIFRTAPSGTAGNAISFTQAMTLDASGNLLVGKTSSDFAVQGIELRGLPGGLVSGLAVTRDGNNALALRRNTNDGDIAIFSRGASAVGSISVTASATAYNTSSDYRLKNITGPITTSGAYIDSLNPVEGTWKADGSTFVGLIAHEVQEASRTTVATGVKDGEQMQGMDYSSAEIIANLIAEVKALRTRVAALESI
jgi:hypothetical protein